MITPTIPPRGRMNKLKQYNLLISVYASQHQAGTALSTNIFGPYDTLEECREAGKEAKSEFFDYSSSYLVYTCVPTYKKNYV